MVKRKRGGKLYRKYKNKYGKPTKVETSKDNTVYRFKGRNNFVVVHKDGEVAQSGKRTEYNDFQRKKSTSRKRSPAKSKRSYTPKKKGFWDRFFN